MCVCVCVSMCVCLCVSFYLDPLPCHEKNAIRRKILSDVLLLLLFWKRCKDLEVIAINFRSK